VAPAHERFRPLTSSESRALIGNVASGLTVVTAADGPARRATTATAVAALAFEPPTLVVCLNEESATGRAISRARWFAVNVLAEHQEDLAVAFAGHVDDELERFSSQAGPHGEPLLDDALAVLLCEVADAVVGAAHTVFVARVHSAVADERVLVDRFAGAFHRLRLDAAVVARREIRRLIAHHELPAGDTVSIDRLASELELPRPAVSLALGDLERENLVLRDGAGRFIVAPLELDDLLDAVSALFVIWNGLVESTIGRVSRPVVDELRRRTEALRPREDGEAWSVQEWMLRSDAFFEGFLAVAPSAAVRDAWHGAGVRALHTRGWSGPGALTREDQIVLHASFAQIVESYAEHDIDATRPALHSLQDRIVAMFAAAYERHRAASVDAARL
jgi:flavin reductase (DIM6/NTAB) family NADH-FMN oxidoreductase RutF